MKLFKETETISSKSLKNSYIRAQWKIQSAPSYREKRRRKDFEEEKHQRTIEEFEKINKEKIKAIDELKEQIEKFESLKVKFIEDEDKLHRLYEMGIIDSAGDFIPYKSDDETDMK